VREILAAVGEDVTRVGLRETPARVAEAYARLFSGLYEDPLRHLDVSFDESARDLVLMRGIPFVSVCEHHLLPMIGYASAAYLPAGRIVGFSEIVRLVEGYAARPEAEHTCMAATGAWRPGTTAVTSAPRGLFAEDPARRAEAMSAIN
jgi:GTP cyclohydrolase I